MPIRLTTAFNPGDLDPGKTYTHVEIYRMSWTMNESIELHCRYGTLDEDNVFQRGNLQDTIVYIRNRPRAGQMNLNELLLAMPLALDSQGIPISLEDIRHDDNPVTFLSTYDNVGNGLYSYLISKGLFEGTVE